MWIDTCGEGDCYSFHFTRLRNCPTFGFRCFVSRHLFSWCNFEIILCVCRCDKCKFNFILYRLVRGHHSLKTVCSHLCNLNIRLLCPLFRQCKGYCDRARKIVIERTNDLNCTFLANREKHGGIIWRIRSKILLSPFCGIWCTLASSRAATLVTWATEAGHFPSSIDHLPRGQLYDQSTAITNSFFWYSPLI